MIEAILDEIERLGGAFKILNHMDIYLKFHPFIRDTFQKMIKDDQKKVEQFYKGKFIDKILLHFYARYSNKKDFLKDVIKESFDTDLINYQDFFYFYEAVLDDFGETLNYFDWENADPVEVKPFLYQKLRKSMVLLAQ